MGARSTRLRLRVSPSAAQTAIVGRHGDGWKVRVAAPPAHGKANDAVVRLVADAVSLPRGDVVLVSGHGSRDKIIELTGMTPAETERRLASAGRKDDE